MKKVAFKVAGESTGQEYELVAEPTNGGLRFTCNCPAGSRGLMCKHRQAIIDGDLTAVLAPDLSDMTMLQSWIKTSRISTLSLTIAALEDEIQAAKRRISFIQQVMGQRLQDGTA